jgi:hypothetical protein
MPCEKGEHEACNSMDWCACNNLGHKPSEQPAFQLRCEGNMIWHDEAAINPRQITPEERFLLQQVTHLTQQQECLKGQLDIIVRELEGEGDDWLANDYGGTGWEKLPSVVRARKAFANWGAKYRAIEKRALELEAKLQRLIQWFKDEFKRIGVSYQVDETHEAEPEYLRNDRAATLESELNTLKARLKAARCD